MQGLTEYTLVFYGSWSSYEEFGWIIILEKEGQYYSQEGGHCVLAGTEKQCDPELVTEEEALELMIEWSEHENTDVKTVEEVFAQVA